MFQFPKLSHIRLCVQRNVIRNDSYRVYPFGNLRVKRVCAPNRSLSQLVTSFIGFLCQGIHRVPLPSYLSNGLVHTYTINDYSLMRSDAIFFLNKKIIVCYAIQLSRYTQGMSPEDRTLCGHAT